MDQVTVPSGIAEKIINLSEEDLDLLAEDRKRHERDIFYARCLRIWQKMKHEDRDEIRSNILETDPDLEHRTPHLLRALCVDAVGRLLRERGLYETI